MPKVKRFRTSEEKEFLQGLLARNPTGFRNYAAIVLGGFKSYADPQPTRARDGELIHQSHVDLRDLKSWIREKLAELDAQEAIARAEAEVQKTKNPDEKESIQ